MNSSLSMSASSGLQNAIRRLTLRSLKVQFAARGLRHFGRRGQFRRSAGSLLQFRRQRLQPLRVRLLLQPRRQLPGLLDHRLRVRQREPAAGFGRRGARREVANGLYPRRRNSASLMVPGREYALTLI